MCLEIILGNISEVTLEMYLMGENWKYFLNIIFWICFLAEFKKIIFLGEKNGLGNAFNLILIISWIT